MNIEFSESTASSQNQNIDLLKFAYSIAYSILCDVDSAMLRGDVEIDEDEALPSLHRIRGRAQALRTALRGVCDE